MTKQLARAGLAVLITLLALLVVWQFRIVVIYLLISLILAAAMRPLANRLSGRRFMVRTAWMLLYLVVIAGFGYLLFLTGRIAVSEFRDLTRSLSAHDAWMLPKWLEGSIIQQTLVAQIPTPSSIFNEIMGDQGQLVFPLILSFTQSLGAIVSGALIILFLSIYWSLNQVHFERLWLSLLPSNRRKQSRGIWRIIEPDIGGYIRGQVFQSLLAGIVLGLGYWLLGSPYPALLALAGSVACLVPMLGVALVVVPVLLVGLLTSLQLGVGTAIFALVFFIILGIWIKPLLFNRRWDNPILTLVLLIAMASAFGIPGIIVAPPLSAVCQILWSRLVSHRLAAGPAAQISDLKERQAHVWEMIKKMSESPPPLVTSSMERLTGLIEKAEPLLQAVLPTDLTTPKPTLLSVIAESEAKDPLKSRRKRG